MMSIDLEHTDQYEISVISCQVVKCYCFSCADEQALHDIACIVLQHACRLHGRMQEIRTILWESLTSLRINKKTNYFVRFSSLVGWPLVWK